MPLLRVLFVDDCPEFIESAVRFLSRVPQIEIVGRALSGQAALEFVRSARPDLVLMDWTLPGMNGLDATRKIKAQPNAPQVIVLSLHDFPEYRAAAAAAGANGFVPKSELGKELVPLIGTLFRQTAPAPPR